MVEFNFQGGDVTASGGQYGNNVIHAGTTVTEHGVDFTYSSNVTSEFPGGAAAPNTTAFNITSGAATLFIVDTNGAEQFLNAMSIAIASYSGSGQIVLSNTTNGDTTVFNLPNTVFNSTIGPFIAANAATNYNQVTVTMTTGYVSVEHIGGTPNCFAQGTLIATERGDVAVEDLKAGDLVCTKDGRLTPVTWLGTQKIDTQLMHPAKVNPVCITAGALGNGLPNRDLMLSPDHAVEIDGTLYNAGALVNGSSIYQLARTSKEGFTYYHVETEAHDLLLAEGVASESFIDYAGRDSFDNGADAADRMIAEMQLPRVSAKRLVPAELQERIAQNATPEVIAA